MTKEWQVQVYLKDGTCLYDETHDSYTYALDFINKVWSDNVDYTLITNVIRDKHEINDEY